MDLLVHIVTFLSSIIIIWFFAGLVVDSVDRVSRAFKKSGFIVAFFMLGFLTSLSEISVAVNSILGDVPQVSAGNLVGASFVLLVFVVPLLALLSRGVSMNKVFKGWKFLMVLGVIALPSAFFLDGGISPQEGVIALIMYILLIWGMRNRTPEAEVSEIEETKIPVARKAPIVDGLKITIGALMIFFAGYILVEDAVYFSEVLNAPRSMIGILLLSIGTNIPELAIAVRAVFKRQSGVALGNYLGSAAMNTLIFAVVAIISGPFQTEQTGFFISFIFMIIGFLLLYVFMRSKDVLSWNESAILLALYALFVFMQVRALLHISIA